MARLSDCLVLCPKGKLKLGILPVATFASGHTFFVQRMYEKLEQQAYVVHATFQFSGTHGKRHRLREALLWDVDPPGILRWLTTRSGRCGMRWRWRRRSGGLW